jgi:hypothetical protein
MATLRHLVPVLGILALVPALRAEDKAPVVTFSGWSDNIFSISDNNTEQSGPATAKSTQAPTARFTAAASLKTAWKVGDKVSGKINAWFYPDDGTTGDPLNIREAYAVYQATETIGLQMGKYIDHIGWISAEPTGLYLVNASLIGYTANTYGNDVLGAAVLITPKDSPIAAQLHVTNGYYTGTDAYSYNYDVTSTNPNRANSDMGWGFDLTYALPSEMGSVNLEGAYDIHSNINAPDATYLGGSVAYLGLNLTLKPAKDLLVGFEVQAKQAGKGKSVDGSDYGGDESIYQGMILANYALSGTPFPMSVTLSDQYIVALNDEKLDEASASIAAQGKVRSNAIQAALLTNPTGSANFGLNLEVGYYQIIDGIDDKVSTRGWETALEALVTF